LRRNDADGDSVGARLQGRSLRNAKHCENGSLRVSPRGDRSDVERVRVDAARKTRRRRIRRGFRRRLSVEIEQESAVEPQGGRVSDGLPEIYWYGFWVGLVVVSAAWGFYSTITAHRRNMKALEVLKLYAEKGTAPPEALADRLAKQILSSPQSAEAEKMTASGLGRRGSLLQNFIGFLFCACVSWALAEWLIAEEAARWAIFASRAAFAFFGFGAFGLLAAALLTREK
jgi:hypothetical protein